jgi:methanogenic corrinoid protein MtbC1
VFARTAAVLGNFVRGLAVSPVGKGERLDCLPDEGSTLRLQGSDCWSPGANDIAPMVKALRVEDPSGDQRRVPLSSGDLGLTAQPVGRICSSGVAVPLSSPSAGRGEVLASQVAELSELVLEGDISQALAYLRTLHGDQGLSLEDLCQRLLAPAARHMGEMWDQDLCHFADVTLGLWRLQQVLREFSEECPPEAPPRTRSLTALLLAAPGEQHTFGLSMVMEFFRRSGWDICGGPPVLIAELADTVRESWFDIVGFSVSSDKSLEALAAGIREVRLVSRNRFVGVMVGGKLFADRPELAERVGADVIAMDGHLAPFQAEQLVARLARRLG